MVEVGKATAPQSSVVGLWLRHPTLGMELIPFTHKEQLQALLQSP